MKPVHLKEFFAKRKIILLSILVFFIALVFFIFREPETELAHLTETVRRVASIEEVVAVTGQIGPLTMINVGAQVSGQIETLHVELGQLVQAGDLLVELDASTKINDLETAKSRFTSYKEQLKAKQIGMQMAQAKYDRELGLYEAKASSKESLDNASSALASARAAVAEMNALILQTELDIDTKERNVGYARITAPSSGTIVAILVEEGQTVNAAQSAPTLLQIVDLNKLEMKLEISEADITKVAKGMPVEFNILSDPTRFYETVLESIDPAYKAVSAGTYNKNVLSTEAIYYFGKAPIDNPDGLFRIGMTIEGSIIVNQKEDILAISTLSVKTDKEGNFVYVFKDNKKPTKQRVTIGISDDILVEIISGLSDSDEVIISFTDENAPMNPSMQSPSRGGGGH